MIIPSTILTTLVLAGCGSGSDTGSGAADRAAKTTRAVVAGAGTPVRVGRAPVAVAVTEGAVWVLDQGDGRLRRVDPASGRPEGRPVRVGPSPLGLAAGEGALWMLDGREGVRRIDLETGRASGPAVAVADPNGIAVGAGGVWVTSRTARTVTRVDAATLRRDPPIKVGAGPADIVFAAGGVWVAEADSGSVTRIDARTRKASRPLKLAPGQVLALAAGDGAVYAAVSKTKLNDDLQVVRIDPKARKVAGAPAPITGGVPLRLAAGNGSVWATDVGSALPGSTTRPAGVLRLDDSGTPASRVTTIAGRPSSVATGPRAVWVTDSTRGTLTRIDLR